MILNTDFTQITPVNGPPINVAGGVFQFRNVSISAGVTVKGTGSNPMVWLVTNDFTIDGLLTVQGEDGHWVNPDDRWMEGSPVIVTGYTLLAIAAMEG